MLEIRDFAALLHIHPTHLTNTIKQTSGRTPCDFFEARILAVAQQLLAETSLPINEIAAQLTYDPSNFTKFFKRFSGMTPKQYRSQATASVALTPPSNRRKTEALTI
jgi:AraC-like DNA-binding protein